MPAEDRYSGGGGGGGDRVTAAAASASPPADPFITAASSSSAAAAAVVAAAAADHDCVSVDSASSETTYDSQRSSYSGDSQKPISIKADHGKGEKEGLEGGVDGDDQDSGGMRGGGGSKFVISQLEKFFFHWGGLGRSNSVPSPRYFLAISSFSRRICFEKKRLATIYLQMLIWQILHQHFCNLAKFFCPPL